MGFMMGWPPSTGLLGKAKPWNQLRNYFGAHPAAGRPATNTPHAYPVCAPWPSLVFLQVDLL